MKTLDIPLNTLIKNCLSLDDYFILWSIYTKQLKALQEYVINCKKLNKENIGKLINNTYLRSNSEDYKIIELELTDKAKGLFPKKIDIDWIKEWYDLFPRGIMSGGYPIKTDPKNCKVKMLRFMSKYPDYSKEIIMEATKLYLTEKQNEQYHMCKLAPYFIEKDGMSMLSGYCEKVVDGVVTNFSFKKDI